MHKLLIIPDVHGRKFWRKAIEKYPNIPRVFLGDYVDPYTAWERISMSDAVEELKEIIDLKKREPDLTILLLGNHCIHYLWDEAEPSSRYHSDYREELQELYGQVEFKVAHQEGSHLFTHAGCTHGWFKQRSWEVPENLGEFLNDLTKTSEGRRALADIGRCRGGYAPSGGPMWADLSEHYYGSGILLPGLVQVFGHSQLKDGPFHDTDKLYWCLDCRKAFILDDEGNITEA